MLQAPDTARACAAPHSPLPGDNAPCTLLPPPGPPQRSPVVAVCAFFASMNTPPSSRPQLSATSTVSIRVPRLLKKSATLRLRPPNQ